MWQHLNNTLVPEAASVRRAKEHPHGGFPWGIHSLLPSVRWHHTVEARMGSTPPPILTSESQGCDTLDVRWYRFDMVLIRGTLVGHRHLQKRVRNERTTQSC